MPLTPEHSSSQHDYVDLNSENRPARVQGSEGLLLKGFAEERKKKSSQVGNFELRTFRSRICGIFHKHYCATGWCCFRLVTANRTKGNLDMQRRDSKKMSQLRIELRTFCAHSATL